MELHKEEININRYANGELSGDELKAFETLLQTDEALQKKVDSHKFMDEVLFKNLFTADEDEQNEIKPLLNELGTKYFTEGEDDKTAKEPTQLQSENETSSSRPTLIRRLLPYAAFAAAAAFLLFLFIPNTKNELFVKYFELPDNQTKMGQILTTFDKANKAYKTKNFKEAILLYDEFLLKEPNNPKALLYKGGAELSLSRTSTAIATFQKLVQNPRYVDIANWYLALSHLNIGSEEQTKTILKSITLSDKEYYNKAQHLLKEL